MHAFSLWLILLPGTGMGIEERMLNKANIPLTLERHDTNYVNALMHKLSLWKVLARKAKHMVHVINKGDTLHTWQERPLEMMTHEQRTRSWERHRLKRGLQAEGLEVRNQVSRKLMKGLLAASQWVWKEGCEGRLKGRWRGKDEGPCRVWFKQMSSPFERCIKSCFSRSRKAGILFPDVIDPQYWFLIGPWASPLYF